MDRSLAGQVSTGFVGGIDVMIGITALAVLRRAERRHARADGACPLVAASHLADAFAARDMVAALLSAIVAGAVMTLLTWLAHAAHEETAKIAIAVLVGFVLAAPSLNHAVVSVER